MANTSRIRLLNFYGKERESLLSYVQIYVDNQLRTVKSISHTGVPGSSALLVNDNTEVVIPNGRNGYIEIELTTSTYVEQFIYVQLRTHSLEKYWLSGFDIYYDHGDNDDWRFYMMAGPYKYPGIDTLTELPIMSAGAVNKSVTWSNVGNNINAGTSDGHVSELGTHLELSKTNPSGSSYIWNAQTNQTVSTGKWYIELESGTPITNNVFSFLLATQLAPEYLNTLVTDTIIPSGEYIGLLMYDWTMWIRQTNNSQVNITNSSTYRTSRDNVTVNSDLIRSLFKLDTIKKVGTTVAIKINFDDHFLEFSELIQDHNRSPNWIRYDFSNAENISNFTVSRASTTVNITKDNLPSINLGYKPFIGKIPEGYKGGFGEEISIEIPAWLDRSWDGVLRPTVNAPPIGARSDLVSRLPNFDDGFKYIETIIGKPIDAFGGNIPANFIDLGNIIFSDPGKNQAQHLSYSDKDEQDILDIFFVVDWVKYDPPRGVITRFGEPTTTGYGYIKSTVSKLTGSVMPIRTKVSLLDIINYRFMGFTFSDPVTGEFEFKHISEDLTYNVLAYDPNRGWVTGIGGPWKAKRMPEYEGLEFDNWFKPR